MLLATPLPLWEGATVGDLVEYAQRLELALYRANADKAAIRAVTHAPRETGE